MPFNYTFRSDDIGSFDVDTRDLLENRDRELELYASTIDSSFLNLNADNLTSGTVPSSRVTGAYTGITQVGTLSAGVASYSIGDTGPSGGKVFITPSTSGNTTGLYFEVAPVSAQVQRYWAQFTPVWYNSTSVPLAQFDTIGTGKTNTVAIVNQGNNDPTVSAAKYCDDYTYGGFSDWFLPSRDELTQIYTNRVALGNDFGIGYFWSSSEEVYDGAWVRFFTNGADTTLAKGNNVYVRPVRSFSTIGLNVRGSAVVRTAATQDGVILTGRAGGTSDYAVSILPTTLSASRTVTLPDVTGTMITTGNLSDITSVGTLGTLNVSALNSSGTMTASGRVWAQTDLRVGNSTSTVLSSTLYNLVVTPQAYTGLQVLLGEHYGLTGVGTTNNDFTVFANATVRIKYINNTIATFNSTGMTIDGAGSPSFTLGDTSFTGYSGITGDKGYLLVGNSISDTTIYLRSTGAGGVYLGASNSNTLQVFNGSTTFIAGSGVDIRATSQTLINGTNNNAGIYLGGGYASTATGGIEASWRDAANPTIAIGVTRDNNRTMTVHSFADNTIRFYSGNTVKAYVNGSGFLATHYYGNVQYGNYGSLSVYGTNGGWYGIVFPDDATTWMSAANGQYFGCYRNNTTWNFYVINGTFTPSDERYKRDIEPLQHGMNLIREIVPITFDPLTEDPADDPEQTVGRTHYGFTTQNILQALANVGETRDVAIVDIGGPAMEGVEQSDRQYLNHSALIAPIVKAIQELDQRLQQLETV